MLVEIWSDVACPWCYVGKRRLEKALARFEHHDEVEVVWRSFELDPRAPAEREGTYVARLARKYRTTISGAEAMMARTTGAAAGEGIEMRFDIFRPGNTFDAHRLLHLAAQHGVQDQLKERLFAALFTEGQPIGLRPALERAAVDVGLEPEAVRDVLDGDAFGSEVRADQEEAVRLGITGVPFFVFGRHHAVGGAQKPELLLDALNQAWNEELPASTPAS